MLQRALLRYFSARLNLKKNRSTEPETTQEELTCSIPDYLLSQKRNRAEKHLENIRQTGCFSLIKETILPHGFPSSSHCQLLNPMEITPAVIKAIPNNRLAVIRSLSNKPPRMTPAIIPTSRVGAT